MTPLAGLTVIALEQAVAAPTCTRRLADAGARVIKLERPEGDFARGYDTAVHGEATYFVWLNRGKESVICDLGHDEDRKLFEALISEADVFVQNLKPGSLNKLGYPIEDLRARNPRLITCTISGYGPDEPFATRKAYDLLIQAEAGLAGLTGPPDTPSRIGVSVVDVGTGMHAYEAILEALIARGTTGRGTDIHVSMFEAMTEWMAVPLLHGRYGTAPKRQGLKHPSVAPYGVFACSDGVPVLLSIQNDREWRIFAAELLGDPAVGTDPEFATNVARAKNRRRTDDFVAACFAMAPASEIARRLDAADLAYGLLNDVAGVLEHPCLVTTEVTLAERTAEMPARPVRFDGARAPAGRRVPALGAHTDAVRREFVGPSRRRL